MPIEDRLVWNNSSTCDLPLKEAYLYKSAEGQKLSLGKNHLVP